jgi:hypothetical protein
METEFDDVLYVVDSYCAVWYKVTKDLHEGKPVWYIDVEGKSTVYNRYYYTLDNMIEIKAYDQFTLIRDEKEFLFWRLKNADRIR